MTPRSDPLKPERSPPPRLATALLRRRCSVRRLEEVEGDLEEVFSRDLAQHGRGWAQAVYWKEVLLFVLWHTRPREIAYEQARGPIMLKTYFKTALRTLRRNKSYTFINLAGLSLGIACSLLVFLYVRYEVTFDRHHEKADHSYRVSIDWPNHGLDPTLSHPLVEIIRESSPAVKRVVRFTHLQARPVRHGENLFSERITFTDPEIWDLFSFSFRSGDPATALADINAMVLTAPMAEKYFGDKDPVGQTLSMQLNNGDFEDVVVTAVLEPWPSNSILEFDFLMPIEKYRRVVGERTFSMRHSYNAWAFVEVDDPAQVRDIEARLTQLTEQRFYLEPLTEVHLNEAATYAYVLSGIALIVLLIACINFMTLSLGRSTVRAKEIGVRKVLGAVRFQLIKQFWGEALLMSIVALVAGMLLAQALLPIFNTLADRTLTLNYFTDATTLLVLGGLLLVISSVVGLYPAFVLSRFQPIAVLRNKVRLGGKGILTQSLVVVQFACSVFLIVSTLVMTNQLDYLRTKDLGIHQEQLIVVQADERNKERYRDVLASYEAIVNVTGTSYSLNAPGQSVGMRGADAVAIEGTTDSLRVTYFSVDHDYLPTMGITLLEGRNFSHNTPTDSSAVLVNETFIRQAGWDTGLGKTVGGYAIIGVVKDFHFRSMHERIEPLALALQDWLPNRFAVVRIRPDNIPGTLDQMEKAWGTIAPDQPFTFFFLDEVIDQQYRTEQRWRAIITYTSFLALLIACLGLFGLATLAFNRRIKEIGIRKVLGASVPGLLNLLSRDVLTLMLIANVVAWPAAYFAMQGWLDVFAYRIELGLRLFVVGGVLALSIALLTVSYQAIKAALADPVKSLRYE